MLAQVEPQDLIKFGLIPEFVGRLPVMGVLNDLDEDALVEILSKPKNAIVKQYQRLFEFENVKLRFTEEALRSISREAMTRKVGARGLRMILEELMLDLMYHLPSQKRVKEFEVTKEMVENRNVEPPHHGESGLSFLVFESDIETARLRSHRSFVRGTSHFGTAINLCVWGTVLTTNNPAHRVLS